MKSFLIALMFSILSLSCAPEDDSSCMVPEDTYVMLCTNLVTDCPLDALAYQISSSLFLSSDGTQTCGEDIVTVTERYYDGGDNCRVSTTFHTYSDENGFYDLTLFSLVEDCYYWEMEYCTARWEFSPMEM